MRILADDLEAPGNDTDAVSVLMLGILSSDNGNLVLFEVLVAEVRPENPRKGLVVVGAVDVGFVKELKFAKGLLVGAGALVGGTGAAGSVDLFTRIIFR